jgi:hypothetical protein
MKPASSVVFGTVADFIAWFIEEHTIIALTIWNVDLRNSLQQYSSKLSGTPSSKELEKLIKTAALLLCMFVSLQKQNQNQIHLRARTRTMVLFQEPRTMQHC